MLTNILLSLGFTRDSATWLWSRIVTLALIVSTGLIDFTQYGLTEREIHLVTAAAAAVLWLAGKYDSSPLPGGVKK